MAIFPKPQGLRLFASWAIGLLAAIMLSAALTVATADSRQQPQIIRPETTPEMNLRVFDALWEKVNREYFDPKFNGADWAGLRASYRPLAEKAQSRMALLDVLQKLVNELKTSHIGVKTVVKARAVSLEIAPEFDRKRDLLFIGLGFDTRIVENRRIVTGVEEKAAEVKTAGISPGCEILEIDDMPFEKADFGGKAPGDRMKVKFIDASGATREAPIPFGLYVSRDIRESRLLDGNLGYVRFTSFSSGADKWFEQEVVKYASARGLILDLRGNTGGYVGVVQNCLRSIFPGVLEFGIFVSRSGREKANKLKGRGEKAYQGTLTVLIDERTASGGEIFAALVRENRRGLLIGSTTSGQVLNSRDYKLPHDFLLSLAFRDYITPQGIRLEDAGVRPDIEISPSINDIRSGRNPELTAAIGRF